MTNRLKQPSPFRRAGLFPLELFFCWGGAAVAQSGEPTWTGLGPEGGVVLCLAINPGDSTQLYAGTQSGGVFAGTVNAADGTDSALLSEHTSCHCREPERVNPVVTPDTPKPQALGTPQGPAQIRLQNSP